MKKTLLTLAVGLLAVIALASQDLSRPISLEKGVYQDADDLYALIGIGRPSTNRPWTVGELDLIISRAEGLCDSSLEKELLQRLKAEAELQARWTADDFGFTAALDLNAELYAHSNTEDFVVDTDWVHGFEDRKPLARARLELTLYDFFYSYCDLQYGFSRGNSDDRYVYLDDSGLLKAPDPGYVGSYPIDSSSHMLIWSRQYSSAFATSFLEASRQFDFDWPKRAIISLGSDRWSLSFNRDRINLGGSAIASMLLDDHRDYTDFLRFNVFSDHFKYEMITVFLNTLTSSYEEMESQTRLLLIHLLEFRPLENLTFTISENVSARFDGPMNLSCFNPAFIYHNLNNRSMFNAIAWLDASWMPIAGLEIKGQFVLDQATAPNESSSQKSAIGFSAGATYTAGITGMIAKADLELAITNPLLYRRDQVDFLYIRRSFHLDVYQMAPEGYTGTHSSGGTIHFGSYASYFDYIGFPYGGDAQTLQAAFSLRSPGSWAAMATAFFMRHGQVTMFSSHSQSGSNAELPNLSGSTPTGDAIAMTLALSLEGAYSLEALRWPALQAHMMLDYIRRWDVEKATGNSSQVQEDLQLTLGLSVSI